MALGGGFLNEDKQDLSIHKIKNVCEINLVDVLDNGRVGRLGHPFISQNLLMLQFEKVISPQNRQLIVYLLQIKLTVVCGELTFKTDG